MLKSRGPILRVTSSETRSVCVKQALTTCRWLVNALVTWHVSYKNTTLTSGHRTPPWISAFNTWAMSLACSLHRAMIGFSETIRNWHEERYFTSFSRGIGIQFSTSNNTTSLNDHWLVYRHCAKLRHWDKVEKYHLPYEQATTLSPISPLFVCTSSAQLWKC